MHSFRRGIVAAIVALAIAVPMLGGAPVMAAPAAPDAPMSPSIVWSDARLDVVFADPVQSSLRMPGIGDACEQEFDCRIEISARGGSFAPPLPETPFSVDATGVSVAFWGVEGGTAVLPAGTHELDAALTLPDGAVVRTAEPLTIEVAQGTLTTTVRVDEDAGDRSGAVVVAQLGGDYLGSVNSSQVGQPLRTPAGTWSIVITDETGAVVFDEQRSIAAGGPVASSWYWSGVPAAAAFTASATFSVAGEAEGNVSVQQPATADFESPEALAPPIVEITPTTVPEPTVGDDVQIPTGAVAVAGFVAFVLLAVAIVLAVRLERRVASDGAAAPRTLGSRDA